MNDPSTTIVTSTLMNYVAAFWFKINLILIKNFQFSFNFTVEILEILDENFIKILVSVNLQNFDS